MPYFRFLVMAFYLFLFSFEAKLFAQKETDQAVVSGISASKSQKGNPAIHVLDSDSTTRWAAEGSGQWIQIELSQESTLETIQIGFDRAERKYRFDLLISNDGKKWTKLKSYESAGKQEKIESFTFDSVKAKYLRMVSNGSSANKWANIHTVKLKGIEAKIEELAKLTKAAKGKSPNNQKVSAGKLEYSRWSGDVNVPDPVAISFDNQGRAYVTQTQRRKSQDLDIRNNRGWIPDDVGFQSVEEKRAYYHKQFPIPVDGSPGKGRINDFNKDGSKDYRDLMFLSEMIHRLEDTNGDGTADKISLYAEDFKTEVTGIAAGVLWHEGDVYTTIAPDVWRLRDTNGDGQADKREIIATGFGLHVAYAGHDMHGLTVGPDGKLYWTIGDKGISAISKDGKKYHYPNQGGCMRCNPDGSEFEVFAHGLRNIQEIAFDKYGNLFGVDNDADQSGERERVVYIVEGMDAGWRCNYQYRGKSYNPWTKEKIWNTWHAGQPAYVTPPLAYSLNGPAGFAYNPGTALNAEYQDYFFLTGAPGGQQHAFQLKPAGASFTVENEHKIGNGVPLVGINFGPDGGLYGVDWGGGYPLNKRGAVWKIDAPDGANSPARKDTQQILAEGFQKREVSDLVTFLSHADQRVRLGSQFELVKRKQLKPLQAIAKQTEVEDHIGRIHAIWGLGQLARSSHSADEVAFIANLLKDTDPQIRVQSLRVLTDCKKMDGRVLVPMLKDADPQVQFQAAIALRKHPAPDGLEALVEVANSVTPENTYLRHAVSLGLSGISDVEKLGRLSENSSPMVRLIAVIALRHRLEISAKTSLANFVNDYDPLVATEAALAIYEGLSRYDANDKDYSSQVVALASILAKTPHKSEALIRRAIGAAYLLRDVKSAELVAQYAGREAAPVDLRLEAMDALSQWAKPPQLDRVDGRRRPDVKEERQIESDAIAVTLLSLFKNQDASIRAASLKSTRDLGISFDDKTLNKLAVIVSNPKASSRLRSESLATLSAQSYSKLDELIQAGLKSNDVDLRIQSLKLLKKDRPSALKAIGEILKGKSELKERQHAIGILADLSSSDADALLLELLLKLDSGKATAGTELEILEAAGKRKASTGIGDLLSGYESKRSKAAVNNPLAPWSECLTGGNIEAGREIFMTHITAQCIRCHKIGKTGSTVGPSLESVGLKRKPEYILQSILDPSAEIEPKYQSVTLVLDSGKVAQGLLLRKTDTETILANAQGKEVKVKNDEIEEMVEQKKSIMPEMTKVLKRREIRDVMAFLQTLRKPLPPKENK